MPRLVLALFVFAWLTVPTVSHAALPPPIVEALAEGPLDPDELKQRTAGRVRNLGPEAQRVFGTARFFVLWSVTGAAGFLVSNISFVAATFPGRENPTSVSQ